MRPQASRNSQRLAWTTRSPDSTVVGREMASLTSWRGCPQSGSLFVGSQSVTPADIVRIFEDRLTVAKAAVSAEAARTAAVKANRDKRAQTAAFVSSIKRIVQGMFSQSPDTLAE
ncbi:MAG: hypothetical protein JOZ69_09115, partial [Myxococcales bacterium]|nr:hypothetical protein [Myxococcales bacterium]